MSYLLSHKFFLFFAQSGGGTVHITGTTGLPLDLTAREDCSPSFLFFFPFFCLFKTARMSGQSITDRITAAQHSVTGSAVSKTVCKATTHEVMGPKKKHLECKCHGNLYYAAFGPAYESYVSHSSPWEREVLGSRPAKDSRSVLLVLFNQRPLLVLKPIIRSFEIA